MQGGGIGVLSMGLLHYILSIHITLAISNGLVTRAPMTMCKGSFVALYSDSDSDKPIYKLNASKTEAIISIACTCNRGHESPPAAAAAAATITPWTRGHWSYD